MSALVLRGVSVVLRAQPLLIDIHLEVEAGEIVALVGGAGSGKSTLGHALMGQIASEGFISICGLPIHDLPTSRRVQSGLHFIPHDRALFDGLSVEDNLRIPGARHFEGALEFFPALRTLLRQAAGTLSGGERQMLALARALVARPKVLLLDEPLTGLSLAARNETLEALRKLSLHGVAVLALEQDGVISEGLAHRTLNLESGQLSQNPASI